MPEDPARKIAIVTGGMSGIGAAVADRLAADGLTVVAADLSAETTALQPGNGIHPYRMDVNDAAAVDDLISAVTGSYGQLDCVVHCAGIGRVASFLDTTLELFDLVVRTNLYGTFLVGQASARAMVSTGGGVIVNIGSVSGLRGNAGRAAYGASKGAVITLSQVMAVELAQSASASTSSRPDRSRRRLLHRRTQPRYATPGRRPCRCSGTVGPRTSPAPRPTCAPMTPAISPAVSSSSTEDSWPAAY